MATVLLSRRECLLSVAASALVLPGCATQVARPPAGSAGADIAFRLDRVTWGVNDSAVSHVRRAGFDAWLDGQLRSEPDRLPADVAQSLSALSIVREPLDQLVLRLEGQRKAADAVVDDDQKKEAQQAYQQELNRLAREAMSRQVLLALYSPRQVQEQMAWFWSNHFSVHQGKHNLRAMLGDWDHTLRVHALGRFRDLLGAATRHPAMLRYLDNEQNAAGRINENHARELMELHTLGVDGGYSQADVQELARVLTGVGVNLTQAPTNARRELQALVVRRGLFEFNPNRHDFGPKQLLGRPITAKGLPELEEALDRLAAHPATARHVCGKLAEFWMADAPPPAVIEGMVQVFRRSDGDIARVLSSLFQAPGFWQARKFKDPTRYVLSAVRLAYDDRTILNPGPVLGWLGRLGEQPWGRQTPDGYPLEASAWSSAGQMATRFEIARSIGGGGAGLFRPDEPGARDLPGFPQLSTPLYYEWRAPALSVATRQALAQATSPQEWNAFLLSSPEFMQR